MPELDNLLSAQHRAGTAVMLDVASFVAHVRRFMSPESVIFLNPDMAKPTMLAVLDYHDRVNLPGDDERQLADGALPRAGRHKTFYAFPVSVEWKAWAEKDGVQMSQRDFADFMEDRIGDVLPPPDPNNDADKNALDVARALGGSFAAAADLMAMSRGLKININKAFKEAINRTTGESDLVFVEEHKNEAGQPLRVPGLFRIGIPVFFGEAAYPITVQLRYRPGEGGIKWTYSLYRKDVIFDHAIGQVRQFVGTQTGLPVLLGKPEA
ncbi:Protein of unkown function DUF2303 [uncultured Caudovirales phage]|uniref:Protein of unkown function DUF2303 n=1 Tax=uncultured Caudovirales phage TaxID=2100421 RepID=A0A6J5LVJ4_9CAUD|nr:Protein of unkown function DUF2303 [uncultured Caudovirales phage]